MNWYLEVIKKYVVFDGRARRKEYWMFTLINCIIAALLEIIFIATGRNMGVSVLMSLYSLALLLPDLGVTVRRLHDTGRSGGFIFLALIPLVGAIILIVFLAQDSQPGANTYGENPKQ